MKNKKNWAPPLRNNPEIGIISMEIIKNKKLCPFFPPSFIFVLTLLSIGTVFFSAAIAFSQTYSDDSDLEARARTDLAEIFGGDCFSGLKILPLSADIIPEVDGEITCICSWETYGGAVLIYNRDRDLIAFLKPGKIREGWAEDLDGDGIDELILRCGPFSATGYVLETVKIMKWDGDKLGEYGNYTEFEGVYMRTLYIPFEISRKLENILSYVRKTCREEGIEYLKSDVLREENVD